MTDQTKPQPPFNAEDWTRRLLELNPWVEENKLRLPGPADWDEEHGHHTGEDFLAAHKAATWARYQAGKEEWNRWAEGMTALQAELEAARLWDVEGDLYPSGDRYIYLQTGKGAESAALTALISSNFRDAEFVDTAGFAGRAFPGGADFRGATFRGPADFQGAAFRSRALFRGATFRGGADFQFATFRGPADFQGAAFRDGADFGGATFRGAAVFEGATFLGGTGFRGATFRSTAVFEGATFRGWADFRGATVRGRAIFEGATFRGGTGFRGATFRDPASFKGATFRGWADFESATFRGRTIFEGATFHGEAAFQCATFRDEAAFQCATFRDGAVFRGATFRGGASFYGATFRGWADFRGATFRSAAVFECATFRGRADFLGATFRDGADFRGATFRGRADFLGATFRGWADFRGATFRSAAVFECATFRGRADFTQVQYQSATSYYSAHFQKAASFKAVQGKEGSSFSLAEARFDEVPDFIQAHFQEAPRLDNVRVQHKPLQGFWTVKRDRDLAARWRNLKRLAIQAHDHQRELDFFAQELKAQRWSEDFPFPWWWRPFPLQFKKGFPWIGRRPKKGEDGKEIETSWLPTWPNGAQYWLGVLFQLFSGFGRSMLRPVLWWALLVVLFAGLNLNQHFEERRSAQMAPAWTEAWVSQGLPALDCIAGEGEALTEALHLSAAKGLVFTGLVSGERTRQTYACLYGLTDMKGRVAQLPNQFTPNIPASVSYWAMLQLLLSVTLITLFLLALRNHFRIR